MVVESNVVVVLVEAAVVIAEVEVVKISSSRSKSNCCS